MTFALSCPSLGAESSLTTVLARVDSEQEARVDAESDENDERVLFVVVTGDESDSELGGVNLSLLSMSRESRVICGLLFIVSIISLAREIFSSVLISMISSSNESFLVFLSIHSSAAFCSLLSPFSCAALSALLKISRLPISVLLRGRIVEAPTTSSSPLRDDLFLSTLKRFSFLIIASL